MRIPDWIPLSTSLPTSLFGEATLVAAGLIALVTTAAFIAFTVISKRSDGPLGPVPGGPLRAGELIHELPSDWRSVDRARFAEIETVSTLKSRMTGLTEHQGSLFIPCDLGFIWRRVSPPAKWLMAIVWLVKRWHKDVVLDGRVVVRLRGRRYPLQATRVEDPGLIEALKSEVNMEARKLLGERLAPRDEQDDEIWFFRLDPR